jgi:hypothetical protein
MCTFLHSKNLKPKNGMDAGLFFQHNALRALCRARTAPVKTGAHFSIWGHTEALCEATLV